jgi:hypothetical protein
MTTRTTRTGAFAIGALVLCAGCSTSHGPADRQLDFVCDSSVCDCDTGKCTWNALLTDLRTSEGELYSENPYDDKTLHVEVSRDFDLTFEVESPKYVHVQVDGEPWLAGRPFRVDMSRACARETRLDVSTASGATASYRVLATCPPSVLNLPEEAYAEFTTSVAMTPDGRTLFVGEPGHELYNSPGRVYIYNWDGSAWQPTAKVESPSESALLFGQSLAVNASGDLLLVGSPSEEQPIDMNGMRPRDSGAAYVLQRRDEAWSIVQRLEVGGAASQGFGSTVAMSSSGDVVVIAASGDGNEALVQIFERAEGGMWQPGELLRIPGDDTTVLEDEYWETFSVDGHGTTVAAVEALGERLVVWQRDVSGWRPQELGLPSVADAPWVSGRVSLSANGERLAAHSNAGVTVFSRDSGDWQNEGTVDITSDGLSEYGWMALSDDGLQLAFSRSVHTLFRRVELFGLRQGEWQGNGVIEGTATSQYSARFAASSDFSVMAFLGGEDPDTPGVTIHGRPSGVPAAASK